MDHAAANEMDCPKVWFILLLLFTHDRIKTQRQIDYVPIPPLIIGDKVPSRIGGHCKLEPVSPTLAGQDIVARASIQHVVLPAAVEGVLVTAPDQDVVATLTFQLV